MYTIFGQRFTPKYILDAIADGCFQLYGEILILSPIERILLGDFIQRKLISTDELRHAISQGICTVGVRCYREYLRGEYPDHTSFPRAFGYAIKYGAIPPVEAQRIKFDHGATLKSFGDASDGLYLEVLGMLLRKSGVAQKNARTCS